MRILYANSLYPTPNFPTKAGGAESFAVRLCEGLVRDGHEVAVVRIGMPGPAHLQECVGGVVVHTVPLNNIYCPWPDMAPRSAALRAVWHFLDDLGSNSKRFAELISAFKPDILHTNNLAGLTTRIWEVAKAACVPIVHTTHDYYLTCPKATRFKLGGRCSVTCSSCKAFSRNRRSATSRVDAVVGVSGRILEIHREQGLFRKTTSSVILNLPVPRLTPAEAKKDFVSRPVTFGYIGRAAIEKGIFELLNAFVAMPDGQARLIVAGMVDEDVRTWLAGNSAGKDITLLGFVSPEDFFPNVDVVVVPSLWDEPCPMVIGEALSYACPVLGARRGGIPEMLSDPGLGWLFEPETSELASILNDISYAPAQVTAKSTYIGTQQDHKKSDSLVSGYLSVYKQIMPTCAPRSVSDPLLFAQG